MSGTPPFSFLQQPPTMEQMSRKCSLPGRSLYCQSAPRTRMDALPSSTHQKASTTVPCLVSGMDVLKSGTSIATAVAAGIAAFLLGFAKGKGMDDTIRKRRGIEAVFRVLAFPTLNDDCLYLVAWILECRIRIY